MYIAESWQDILIGNDLIDFDSFWSVKAGWVEQPNYRRGGWSGVSRLVLNLPEGGKTTVYLKRHENHIYRPRLLPWLKKPTLEREKNNLLLFSCCNIPGPELIYFSSKKVEGKVRAVMLTVALENYQNLLSFVEEQASVALCEWRHLVGCLAKAIRIMHQHHIQHTAFYPQHVLINKASEDIRFIDLEGARKRWQEKKCMLRDLDTLQRYTHGVDLRTKVVFFKSLFWP